MSVSGCGNLFESRMVGMIRNEKEHGSCDWANVNGWSFQLYIILCNYPGIKCQLNGIRTHPPTSAVATALLGRGAD